MLFFIISFFVFISACLSFLVVGMFFMFFLIPLLDYLFICLNIFICTPSLLSLLIYLLSSFCISFFLSFCIYLFICLLGSFFLAFFPSSFVTFLSFVHAFGLSVFRACVVAPLLAHPGVDHVDHVVDGHRGLRDVRGQHHLLAG